MLNLIIKNGKIIDGSGCKPYFRDIGISGGKIVKIGNIYDEAERVIDATGLTVTPGFIDSHSHSDNAVMTHPEMREKCEQGITTSVGGQCGGSYLASGSGAAATAEEFKRNTLGLKLGSNLLTFVGHGTVRRAVMGTENRAPTPAELSKMCDIVRECVRGGALGVSFGLIYNPGTFAETDELIAIAKACAEEGGMLSAHIRNESDTLVEAVEEYFTVVRESGARAVLSHHKACLERNHGKVDITLKMLDDINREGYDVYCDVYPYLATGTSACARFIPKEYQANNKTIEHLRDPETRRTIREINRTLMNIDRIDWALITSCKGHPEFEGKYVSEIAEMMGVDDMEAAFRIIELSGNCTSACYFSINERDVEKVIAHPRSMICTDSSVAKSASYHPRLRGSFPRAIRRFVRELSLVPLEEMIRKMTSLPAHVYNLNGKGLIKEGYDADICIFDYEKLKDNADYANPHPRADGLDYVLVSGEVVARDAEFTGAMPARVIYREENIK